MIGNFRLVSGKIYTLNTQLKKKNDIVQTEGDYFLIELTCSNLAMNHHVQCDLGP